MIDRTAAPPVLAAGTIKKIRDEESPSELRARAVVEQALGRRLVRVVATTGPEVVDYRSAERDLAVEVKEVTSSDFYETGDAFAREETLLEDPRLTGRWAVLIQRPDLSTLLPHTGQPLLFGTGRPARLKGLAAELVEHFVVLKPLGVHKTETPLPPLMDPELAAALVAIARRTAGAHYYRTDPVPGRSGVGSVDVLLATGSVRTGVGDTLVDRLELWLADPGNDNLRRSLANEPAGTARHAFLVVDHRVEPECRSADEQGAGFLLTRAMALPQEIDVLWVLVGPVAARYDPEEGWSTWLAPPEGSAT